MTVLARTHHCHCVKPSEHITSNFKIFLRSILRFFLLPLQGLPIVFLHSFFFHKHAVYIYVLFDSCHVTPYVVVVLDSKTLLIKGWE